MKKLTDPIKLGNIWLKNRLVMAPTMTRLANHGFVTPEMVDYYAARARGGVGLIIVEATFVMEKAQEGADLGIAGDKFIPGLKRLAAGIQRYGAKAAIQLSHPGAKASFKASGERPAAPSPVPLLPGLEPPRELTKGDIQEIIAAFAEAAQRAIEAGFDAVEFHGAHTKLLMQFLSPLTNHRSDEYGGTPDKRMRFPLEVVATVRNKIGPGLPLSYRLGAMEPKKGGITLEEAKVLAKRLETAGVNCLHISVGGGGGLSIPPMTLPRAVYIPLAGEIKKVVKIPVIGVGRVNDPFLADSMIRDDRVDMVAVARPLMADPDFMANYLRGRSGEIRTCLACNCCAMGKRAPELARTRHLTCIYNAQLGKERSLAVRRASVKKRVLVAGGGPAGMESARVAALRGHSVVLCERGEDLGGQIRLASAPPYRTEMGKMITYYSAQLSKLKVDVHCNTEVTAELVADMRPGVIIVANGSQFLMPPLTCIDSDIVRTPADILSGRTRATGNIVVVGQGQYALETAEYLAWRNCHVTVLAKSKELAVELDDATRRLLLERLTNRYGGLNLICDANLQEVGKNEVAYAQRGQRQVLPGVDMLVMAMALVADKRLYEELKPVAGSIGAKIYAVGDCKAPRRALVAVHDAFGLAREI